MGAYSDKILKDTIDAGELIYAVFSNVKKGVEKSFIKLDIKPVEIKGEVLYQLSYQYEQKVLHENLNQDALLAKVEALLGAYFKQAQIFTVKADLQILFNKKGVGTVIQKVPTRFKVDISHNRKKNYLIPEGVPCDFMQFLGVMDEHGKVVKKRYDKYRQLNKYLEFVEDALPYLPEVPTIIDFGCGKAYLTFALYYYLVKIKQKKVKIIGLDLKEDVIEYCSQVASTLKYDGLSFQKGDIKDFSITDQVDMVVSLHACDTATDEAIAKAVGWNAKVIYAVPCCQHELFGQLNNPTMIPLLKHGIVKDKLTTIVTDTLRTCALEAVGYNVQMVEFIDLEHTPKNILIRGFLTQKTHEQKCEDYANYKAFKESWSVKPRIDAVLKGYFPVNTNEKC
ncbi:SAM-dependent methyltransferase [Fusibacter bizertensis]|uniref:SAM-dependent methyltransferase n=1 Tax=Fusibacter bizertensis TaxID=1488331 RepID=A0ABT6NDL7_9FIRM|nr:SAM-dependent methyltransferase [Fusibacter bizertensis]MDH8678486.1 SAM-dependent methyltransferase [Fusibacter bizertensis]